MVLGSTDMLLLDIKWGSNLVTWAFGAKTVHVATLCKNILQNKRMIFFAHGKNMEYANVPMFLAKK